jgi:hypothetical protein
VFDVVDTLEILGSDAELAGASSARLDDLLRRQGMDPALRAALLEGDSGVLRTLLRAPNTVCAIINPAEEEEDAEGEEQDEEGEDDADDDEDITQSRKGPKSRR